MEATINDFLKLDIRIGKIINAEEFSEAKKPAYKLMIDFGNELGVKKSSAQIVKNHQLAGLEGKLVLCVVNFPPRQIGPIISEVLTLATPDENGDPILIEPNENSVVGGKLY